MNCLPGNLKYLRKQRKLRQEEMLDQIGFSRSTWSNYENGHTDPSIDNLIRISSFFGISLDELVIKDLTAGDMPHEPTPYSIPETVSLVHDDGDEVHYLLNQVKKLTLDMAAVRKEIDTLKKENKKNASKA